MTIKIKHHNPLIAAIAQFYAAELRRARSRQSSNRRRSCSRYCFALSTFPSLSTARHR